MPFCPICKYEYRAEIKVCPDCDVELVAEIVDEPGEYDLSSRSDLILAASFMLPVEAQEAKLLLESQGVESVVMDDTIARTDITMAFAVAGVRVMVRRADAEKARGVLEADS